MGRGCAENLSRDVGVQRRGLRYEYRASHETEIWFVKKETVPYIRTHTHAHTVDAKRERKRESPGILAYTDLTPV